MSLVLVISIVMQLIEKLQLQNYQKLIIKNICLVQSHWYITRALSY